ncbi:MAG TPA: ABC-2 family transporter protein [Candidatus Bathyarchaeia archaeon]|nr:ABC-2 family transporter protein [Candidatus Bathyarchaeia archaeon]
MKKYWAIFKISWQRSLEYRAEFLAHMMRNVVYLVVLIFIWGAVFNQVESFGGYTLPSMVTYLVMVRVIHFANRGNTGRAIGEEIKNGQLSRYLVKPVSYLKYWFSLFGADRLFDGLMRLFFLVIALIVVPYVFEITSVKTVLLFLLFLPFSLALNFLVNIFMASFSFWVTDIRLFETVVSLTIGFFAGELMPLDILPGFLKQAALFLPFQYVLYFPVKIYQGTLSNWEMTRGFLLVFFWLLLGYWVLKRFWQKGLKRYEAVGQ